MALRIKTKTKLDQNMEHKATNVDDVKHREPTPTLPVNDKPVEDTPTVKSDIISSYIVKDKSQMRNVVDAKYIVISVSTLPTAKRYYLRVKPTLTMKELKLALQTETGIPHYLQRLVYNKRILNDHLKVRHYNIKDGSTLYLIRRQPPPKKL